MDVFVRFCQIPRCSSCPISCCHSRLSLFLCVIIVVFPYPCTLLYTDLTLLTIIDVKDVVTKLIRLLPDGWDWVAWTVGRCCWMILDALVCMMLCGGACGARALVRGIYHTLLLYWFNPVSQVLRAMAFKRTTRGRSNFGELMTAKIS
jgi:hypothetical protein